jgi:hypothetical protein
MTLRYTSSYDKTVAFSDTDAQLHLTVGSVLTYTLPGGRDTKYTIMFGYNSNSNVWVGLNATPVIPSADSITLVPFVEFRPDRRYAIGGDVLSFITPDAVVYMGISVRSIPN